jgi:hypothetical protein
VAELEHRSRSVHGAPFTALSEDQQDAILAGMEIIYVADPDENVIELTDATLDELVSLTHKAFPESAV